MAVEELSLNDDDLGFPRKINFPICVHFETHRVSTRFLKVDPNGAYESNGPHSNLRGFSNLVWVGLVLGTKTRKKTSPIQVNLEFPLASVLKKHRASTRKTMFRAQLCSPKVRGIGKTGVLRGQKDLYILLNR